MMDGLKLQTFSRLLNLSVKHNIVFWYSGIIRQKSTETESKKEIFSTLRDDDYETTLLEKEQEIERLRNKSRLSEPHRNMIHGKVPYREPLIDTHLTLKYKRRLFGRYGLQSNVDPGTLWPNENEIKKTVEYEQIAFPYTIQETISKLQQKKDDEKKVIEERQQQIWSKAQKLDQWKKEIQERSAKKLASLEMAKAKKDALVEEVRKHFGYKISEQDEKFKELLLTKEKALRKKLKDERTKARQEKMLADMMEKDK